MIEGMDLIIIASLSRANFDLIRKGKKWIGIWGKHFTPERFKKVEPWQKVNHFPMSFEIGRKDKLLLNYQRLRNVFGSEVKPLQPWVKLLRPCAIKARY